jgi:hypothetical protein
MVGVVVLVVAGVAVVGCCWFLVVVSVVGVVLEVVVEVVAGVPVPGMPAAVVVSVALVPWMAAGVVEEVVLLWAWVELSRMGIAEGARLDGPAALPVVGGNWVVSSFASTKRGLAAASDSGLRMGSAAMMPAVFDVGAGSLGMWATS